MLSLVMLQISMRLVHPMEPQKDNVLSPKPFAETLTARVRIGESASSFRKGTDAFMALTPSGTLTIDTFDETTATQTQLLQTNVQRISIVSAHSMGMALSVEGRTYFISFGSYVFPLLYLKFNNPSLLWLFDKRRKNTIAERDRWLNAFKNFRITVDTTTNKNNRAMAISGLTLLYGILAAIIVVGLLLLRNM